ncbi:Arsenite methyltransferase [Bulinus truncatus]|nr:Arsenite methyltransferase [Bulinus truncatus]
MASDTTENDTNEFVKNYYGKCLEKTEDLKTNACSSQKGKFPNYVREIRQLIHDEVKAKYYGCGPVFPPALYGASVLDLGCGSGQDCYILSKLVGSDGRVVGLDMTEEQLAIANKYIDYHTSQFSYSRPNVSFVKGFLEKMEDVGIENNAFDVVVSNCVINLCKDKSAVLREAFRVLKEGGELYFSDIYADQTVPSYIRENEELWCEGFGGALHWKELHKLAQEIGFGTPRLVTAGSYLVHDEGFKKILGDAKFLSATYRLFKLPHEQGKNMAATYNGGIQGYEDELPFDYTISFRKNEECHVELELASILETSRYKKYFTFSNGEKGPCGCSKMAKDPFEYCAEQENKTVCF